MYDHRLGRGGGRRHTGAAAPRRSAAHLISEPEVDSFLSGSVFTEPLWHCTTPSAAEAIIRKGPNPRGYPNAYGYGFWLSTGPELGPSRPQALRVAARITNPVPPGERTGDPLERMFAYRR